MTKAQNWAQKRNFGKFRLEGVLATLSTIQQSPCTLPDERKLLVRAEIAVANVAHEWKLKTPASKRRFMEKENDKKR